MKKRLFVLLALAAIAAVAAGSALAGNSAGVNSTPNHSVTMADSLAVNGTCTAQFNRSASGIINETNRGPECTGIEPGATVQFRPMTGPSGSGNPQADPTCPAPPLGQQMWSAIYQNSDPALAGSATSGLFIGSNPYNACIYYAA